MASSDAEHARPGDDPVGVRVAALGAAATLVAGRGSNRSDRSNPLLIRDVVELAQGFTSYILTGKLDGQ